MGMYDDIKCSYPLPGSPPDFIEQGHVFQTKDMDCCFSSYEITETGKLVLVKGSFWEELVGEREELSYHGDITFYDGNIRAGGPEGLYTANGEDAVWIDYRARFNEGNLVSIVELARDVGPAKPLAECPWHKKASDSEEIPKTPTFSVENPPLCLKCEQRMQWQPGYACWWCRTQECSENPANGGKKHIGLMPSYLRKTMFQVLCSSPFHGRNMKVVYENDDYIVCEDVETKHISTIARQYVGCGLFETENAARAAIEDVNSKIEIKTL